MSKQIGWLPNREGEPQDHPERDGIRLPLAGVPAEVPVRATSVGPRYEVPTATLERLAALERGNKLAAEYIERTGQETQFLAYVLAGVV